MFRICFGGNSQFRTDRAWLKVGRLAFVAMLTLLTSAAMASRSEAATINTYSFTQEGWYFTNGSPGGAVLTGTFTGSVDPDGYIRLANLTAFQVALKVNEGSPGAYTLTNAFDPQFFSFDTLSAPNSSGGNSTLTFGVFIGPDDHGLCVGGLTAFGCLQSANGAYIGPGSLNTMAFPKLTLVHTTAVTPLPAAMLFFGTALAGLGLVGARARRLHAA